MARYRTENKKGTKRLAILEMEGWDQTPEWDWETREPRSWPAAVVAGLVFLFTNTRMHEGGSEGVQIPDILGWHIAALMEAWAVQHHTTAHMEPMPGYAQKWYANGLNLLGVWAAGTGREQI